MFTPTALRGHGNMPRTTFERMSGTKLSQLEGHMTEVMWLQDPCEKLPLHRILLFAEVRMNLFKKNQ
jgi:hypothetical protein